MLESNARHKTQGGFGLKVAFDVYMYLNTRHNYIDLGGMRYTY